MMMRQDLPEPAAVGPAGENAAIREARSAQNRAIATGDRAEIARHWTEDVTMRRGLGQAVTGQAAYLDLLLPAGDPAAALVYQRQPDDIEIGSRWPLAFESGVWAGHLGSAEGADVIGGRYSAQWVKRDGRWLIRSEVYVALRCDGVGCGYVAVP